MEKKNKKMPSQPTNSGIVIDESSGERHIPESVRVDGSTRKAIKIRPGYRPPEDVELYRNRTAEVFRSRYTGGVIGAEAANQEGQSTDRHDNTTASSTAANKNAKRREARKKAKAFAGPGHESHGEEVDKKGEQEKQQQQQQVVVVADSEFELEKRARHLKKKLKQARELQDRRESGQSLLPEQLAKVIKINELVRELVALGFDSDGESVKRLEEQEKAA